MITDSPAGFAQARRGGGGAIPGGCPHFSKAGGAATYAAAKGELVPCGWVCLWTQFEWTLATKLLPCGPSGTARQLILGDVLNVQIVMACLTKMSGAETEPNGDRAAISTLELKVLLAVTRADGGIASDRATGANEL